MSEVVEKIVTRAERLRDLGFTELEIADVSEAGLAAVHSKLRALSRTERDWRRRENQRHVPDRLQMIQAAEAEDRVLRAAFLLTFNQLTGLQIRSVRRRAQRSTDWLAHALECDIERINLIEGGAISLKTSELAAIAEALSVTPLDLVPVETRRRLRRPAPASPAPAGQSPRSEGEPHRSTTA